MHMNAKPAPQLPAGVLLAALALAGATLGLLGCGRPAPPPAPPPTEVACAEVVQEDVPIRHEWIGTLDGTVHAHVHPQATGYLTARRYREGTLVRKGDLMFEIDARPFQAVLDQALARLGKDELDVKRLKPLAQEQAVSQEELDNAMQAYLGDQAAVDQARVNLDFTRVTSPIDGLAGLSVAEIGDLVGPGTTELTTVSTVDPIKVYFTVSEQDYLHHVQALISRTAPSEPEAPQPLELILADGSVYPRKGAFYATDNQMDPRTGALRMAALFANPGQKLLPGQFGRVRLTEIRAGACVVPQRAVMELQGLYQVAIVDATNTVHIRTVTVGEHNGPKWIIEQGVQPGESIVVEGVQKIREGDAVKPVPFTLPAADTNSVQAAVR